MLELKNILLILHGKKIINNLSCSIKKGDFIVILGSNGAGKSSFFDCISGRKQTQAGTITLQGKDITHLAEHKRAAYISRLFQSTQANCVPSMTVAQNLSLSLCKNKRSGFNKGLKELPKEIIEQLQQLSLNTNQLLNTEMKNLSGGQRQLIAFIMATLDRPQLLLLDEPTAALDPQAATQLLKSVQLYTKKNKATTLLITHDPNLARILGNKAWVIKSGQIHETFEGTAKESLSAEKLIGEIDYNEIQLTKPSN